MADVLRFPRVTLRLSGDDVAEQLRPLFEAAIETVMAKIEAEMHRLDADVTAGLQPGRRVVRVRIGIRELLLSVVRSQNLYTVELENAVTTKADR